MELWKTIVETNTFNFVVFLLIFYWLGHKCNVGGLIEGLQKKVELMVLEAQKAKEKSIQELKDSENAVKNVGTEIKNILDNAEVTAEKLGKKILEDAQKQVEAIEKNAKNAVEAEGKKIISSLSQKSALASVELARKHIQSTLKKKPQYHVGFIADSIKELDRLKF